MRIVGTRDAFITMINKRGIYKILGVDTSTVANWKAYLRAGKSISIDKMEEILIKGGAMVNKEKEWEINN